MTIKTILVDDEKLAIQGLQIRLEKFDDIEIVDTCRNGREAIRKIKTLKPDLVFLDIQMPGFDGFSVVRGIMEIEPPLFIFVTAYSEHAVRAFEAEAIDYLVANSPQAENNIVTEVERYIAWPGQALAYKTGQREMFAARNRAIAVMGDRFDIRGFHDALLGSGSVPMPTMHRLVDEWIARAP